MYYRETLVHVFALGLKTALIYNCTYAALLLPSVSSLQSHRLLTNVFLLHHYRSTLIGFKSENLIKLLHFTLHPTMIPVTRNSLSLGFWGQLVLTIVSAVILSFSVVITGKVSSPATFYATSGGIAAGFLSVFWSFGYIRLSDRLRKTSNDPLKAPPRADVVKCLQNGIVLNLLGMGAAILGMQATLGILVAKALTTSANPYSRSGSSPVLALDIFLVQASANVILSHFLGLVLSLELLRSVTLPPSQSIPGPKVSF